MKFSLDREFLEAFLDKHEKGKKDEIEDETLREMIRGAFEYSCEISLIVYFFSKRIQKKQNSNALKNEDLELFYNLISEGFFNYQEFDKDFLNSLFDYSRSRIPLALEEIIVEVQQDLNNNKYDSNFRY